MLDFKSKNVKRKKVVIVGAGPVGCLAACMMSNHGWNVEVYEARPDFRLHQSNERSRSINLAFSNRGIESIKSIEPKILKKLLNQVIPMKSRMIHSLDLKLLSQSYGLNNESINSIDRNLLNQTMLNELNQKSNIQLFFQHKLIRANFDEDYLIFEKKTNNNNDNNNINNYNEDQEKADDDNDNDDDGKKNIIKVETDLTIGTDGSYSKVREQIMRFTRMDFSQEYIEDVYLELTIPAIKDFKTGLDQFALDPNHLHIWPRHSFMLIALPNQDKSFTCTLFAPQKDVFEKLIVPKSKEDEDRILNFFNLYFSDVIPLMGKQNLINSFIKNPRGSLLTIKCNPYHYKNKAIILGDAAHSMVPFYGQGMNCGLEDVRKLNEIMIKTFTKKNVTIKDDEKEEDDDDEEDEEEDDDDAQDEKIKEKMKIVLQSYSSQRHIDLISICDLALNNYNEMRDHVVRFNYIFRKFLDGVLFKILGDRWLPLYTMVTFRSDLNYNQVIKIYKKQSLILNSCSKFLLGSSILSIFLGGYYKFQKRK